MSRRFRFSLASLIFLLTLTVFSGVVLAEGAVTWGHITRKDDLNADVYVGQNAVRRMGNDVIYFLEVITRDTVDQQGAKGTRALVEAVLSEPRQYRVMITAVFDANGNTLGGWADDRFNPVKPGSTMSDEIDFALKYAPADSTNWVRVGLYNDKDLGNYEYFIDKDTVVKKGSSVIFRYVKLYDRESDAQTKVYGQNVKKAVFKVEVNTKSNPRQQRALESYLYDHGDREIERNTVPDPFSPVSKDWTSFNNLIDFTLQYAK